MNIVVLAGGLSMERDVSIVSGTGVCKALRERGHKAILLDVFLGYEDEFDIETIFEEKESLLREEVQIQETASAILVPAILAVRSLWIREWRKRCF